MTTALFSLPTHQPILWFEDAAAADPAPRRRQGRGARRARPPHAGSRRLRRRRHAGRRGRRAGLRRARRAGGEAAAARRGALLGDRRGRLAGSFAGQHETILGVRGIDELLGAIAACRASAHTERALSYRRANGLARPSAPLPVLVQLLVPADAAAVVFSLNPVDPHSGDVLVNAAFGLGESIVGGTVTPDEWALARPSLPSRAARSPTSAA